MADVGILKSVCVSGGGGGLILQYMCKNNLNCTNNEVEGHPKSVTEYHVPSNNESQSL